MRFRAATATSKRPQLPASEYYTWRAPDKALSVQLQLDVVDRLSADVMDAFWAVPKRGAEIGGLLLGKKLPGGAVVIEDYELVPCEHQRGPSYQLSDHDRAGLGRAIARWNLYPDSQVIGYFRSHTREGFRLEDEDGSLIHEYFTGPSNVVLLIKPFARKPSMAGFFIWKDGAIQHDSSYLEFPFSRSELAKCEQLAPETIEQQNPEQEVVSRAAGRSCPAGVASEPAAPRLWPRLRAAIQRRNWLLPAALTSLLLGLVQYGAFRLLSSDDSITARQEQAMPLLQVEQMGRQLHLTWNRLAPAVVEARRGMLLIIDGAYRKELHLDEAQLRRGGVTYLPLTGDMNFRLELEGDHATATESLRVVIPPEPQNFQAELPLNPPAVSTSPVSEQIQSDAALQRAPAKPPAKQRRTNRRRFFDDGL